MLFNDRWCLLPFKTSLEKSTCLLGPHIWWLLQTGLTLQYPAQFWLCNIRRASRKGVGNLGNMCSFFFSVVYPQKCVPHVSSSTMLLCNLFLYHCLYCQCLAVIGTQLFLPSMLMCCLLHFRPLNFNSFLSVAMFCLLLSMSLAELWIFGFCLYFDNTLFWFCWVFFKAMHACSHYNCLDCH